MRYIFLTLFLTFLCWPFADTKAAPSICGPRDRIEKKLEEQFGETKFIAAITDEGALLQIFYNNESGGWTLTITQAVNGMSCALEMGGDYIRQWKPSIPEAPL